MIVGFEYKDSMKLKPLVPSLLLLAALPSYAQNPNAEKAPPANTVVRHPLLYAFDTTALQDRLAEKLEKAPNREVLRWAITQLGEMGEEAIPALRRAFYRNFARAEFFPSLSNICEALGQTKSKSAVPILLDGITHSSGVVRTRALDSLVNIQAPSAFPYLRALFPIESKEYKTRLLNGMASVGSEEFVSFAGDLLDSDLHMLKDLSLQYVAERYVPQGESLLRKAFTHPSGNERLKLFAAMGLVQLGDADAQKHLQSAATQSVATDDRVKAMFGLGAGHKAEALAAFVDASDPAIRQGLVAALGVCLSRQAPAACAPATRTRTMELLRALAKDLNPGVRAAAIKELVLQGDRSAMDPYLDVLKQEKNPDRLREAIDLVMDPQIRETRAAPILAARIRGAGIEQQKLFLQALAALHDEKGVQPILDCLQNPPKEADAAYREYAALQVGFLGKPAVRPLIQLSKETKDPAVRFWAIQALAWTRDPEAAEFLFERLGDAEESLQLRAHLVPQIPSFAGLAGAGPAKRILTREGNPQLRSMLNDVLWDYY